MQPKNDPNHAPRHNATTAFLHEIFLEIPLIFSRMAAEEGDETGMKKVNTDMAR